MGEILEMILFVFVLPLAIFFSGYCCGISGK